MVGCATAPRVGVRSGFENRTVNTVAVAPVWGSSQFGLSDDEWRALTLQVENSVTSQLESLGFTVLGSSGLRDQMERRNAWERFEDVISYRDGIETHFEPTRHTDQPLEVVALADLRRAGAIDSDGLLLLEIVYQSTGTCTEDARDHNQFAVIVTERGSRKDPAPGPCVVTHFQAKLVDTSTGKTMWHNRRLREYRAATIAADELRENIDATVTETIAGEHGIAPFAPNPSRAAIAEQ